MLRAIGEIGLSSNSLGGAPGRLLAAIDSQPAIVERIVNCKSQSAFIGAFSATVTLEVWFLTPNLDKVTLNPAVAGGHTYSAGFDGLHYSQ